MSDQSTEQTIHQTRVIGDNDMSETSLRSRIFPSFESFKKQVDLHGLYILRSNSHTHTSEVPQSVTTASLSKGRYTIAVLILFSYMEVYSYATFKTIDGMVTVIHGTFTELGELKPCLYINYVEDGYPCTFILYKKGHLCSEMPNVVINLLMQVVD
jgi:hypothetical protein